MTNLDERIYCREEQSQPFLTVTSGRPPDFPNDDGERQLPDSGLMEPLGWHKDLDAKADMQQVETRCPKIPRADAMAAKISYSVAYLDLFWNLNRNRYKARKNKK